MEMMNYEAVRAAIETTAHMESGVARMNVIRLGHLDRAHTMEGAALRIPCEKITAYRWQKAFFEEVARNRGFLD